jgi:hypothetical protein
MKVKTRELTGDALDWAVCIALGKRFTGHPWDPVNLFRSAKFGGLHKYSTHWAQGGPIIEREGITVVHFGDDWVDKWKARKGDGHWQGEAVGGQTPLIAAMRCFVTSKLGEEVDIPEEFIE